MAGLGPAIPRTTFWCLIDLATRPWYKLIFCKWYIDNRRYTFYGVKTRNLGISKIFAIFLCTDTKPWMRTICFVSKLIALSYKSNSNFIPKQFCKLYFLGDNKSFLFFNIIIYDYFIEETHYNLYIRRIYCGSWCFYYREKGWIVFFSNVAIDNGWKKSRRL